VRQLAAAFPPASLLAVLWASDLSAASKLAAEESGSKLPHSKASQGCANLPIPPHKMRYTTIN